MFIFQIYSLGNTIIHTAELDDKYFDERLADKMKLAVKDAISKGVSLERANLSSSNLSNINFTGVNIKFADVSYSNLRGTSFKDCDMYDVSIHNCENIEHANLEPYKQDMFRVLKKAWQEVPYLKEAIIKGKIDGTVYEGHCKCLVGTLEKEIDYGLDRNSANPIEEFFYGIDIGDTPETSAYSRLALKWVEEFEQTTFYKNQLEANHD